MSLAEHFFSLSPSVSRRRREEVSVRAGRRLVVSLLASKGAEWQGMWGGPRTETWKEEGEEGGRSCVGSREWVGQARGESRSKQVHEGNTGYPVEG